MLRRNSHIATQHHDIVIGFGAAARDGSAQREIPSFSLSPGSIEASAAGPDVEDIAVLATQFLDPTLRRRLVHSGPAPLDIDQGLFDAWLHPRPVAADENSRAAVDQRKNGLRLRLDKILDIG